MREMLLQKCFRLSIALKSSFAILGVRYGLITWVVQLTKCLYFWKNKITIAFSGTLKELMQNLVWN